MESWRTQRHWNGNERRGHGVPCLCKNISFHGGPRLRGMGRAIRYSPAPIGWSCGQHYTVVYRRHSRESSLSQTGPSLEALNGRLASKHGQTRFGGRAGSGAQTECGRDVGLCSAETGWLGSIVNGSKRAEWSSAGVPGHLNFPASCGGQVDSLQVDRWTDP